MIGRVFNNRYQITERIGIGGMAEVYRAQDNVLGRLVAVKVMLPQYAADPAFTQRFKQEAASAANLQSPYIVNVYDWGQDDGTYYIVMEFVRGSDLKTAIQQRGAINQRKVAEIGSQVCQALSVAHGLDIIHRDIKPQNIMVQPDGNVKVMDFGIARAKNSLNSKTSSVLGTAHYISPEQAQGKELTAASDIYSLGVVLYESATGKLPFDGPDAVSVAMKQVQDLPVPPREINPEIDPALEAIIMKAMEKNPMERFSTAKEMRDALNAYLAGRPINLGGAGFTNAQTQVMASNVPPMNPSNATSVMPAVHGGQHPNEASNHNLYDADNTAPKKGKGKIAAIVIAIIAAIAIIGGIAYAVSSSGKDLVSVPSVTGQSLDSAKSAIQQAGFNVGQVKEESSDSVDEGKVISQDPKANEKKPKGSTINLVVSQGAQGVTVPDLTGKSPDEAKKLLTASGLKYAEGSSEYSSTVDKGRIIRQDATAGSKVNKDTTVTVVISLGEEDTSVSVPNVVGQTRSQATTTINNAGLYVTVQEQSSDTVASGVVISQSPGSGEKVAKDSTITLVVSTGKKTTSVPNVVGQTEGSAMATLQNAGFTVTTEYQSSSTATAGTVISQTPSSGTNLSSGGTVNIIISTGAASNTGNTGGSGNTGNTGNTGGGSGTGSNSGTGSGSSNTTGSGSN